MSHKRQKVKSSLLFIFCSGQHERQEEGRKEDEGQEAGSNDDSVLQGPTRTKRSKHWWGHEAWPLQIGNRRPPRHPALPKVDGPSHSQSVLRTFGNLFAVFYDCFWALTF